MVSNQDCWLWAGYIKTSGYGYTYSRGVKRMVQAHRLVYEALVGDIPDGLQLDHLCRVPRCVNPNHLEPVTSKENTRRGITGEVARDRQLSKSHCPLGHPYSGDNLYIIPRKGHRGCKECRRIANRKVKLRSNNAKAN